MAKPLTADDILPLVACLTPQERLRLLRLIGVRPGADEAGSAEFAVFKLCGRLVKDVRL